MRGLAIVFALALAAMAGHPAQARDVPALGRPQTGLTVIALTVTAADGHERRFKVEYAGTEAQQATGMMYRRHVLRGTGMLFPLTPNRQATFWMHNCLSGLDLIFVAPGGIVESIGANAPPMSDAIVASKGTVAAVLEIGPGEAARLGIRSGDKVSWRAPLADGRPIG